MTDNADEKILARAQEIKVERNISLTDAMIRAEEELAPKPTVPADFTVTIPVKPRVARWIVEEFAPTKTHTTEERLAAYLGIILNRARVTAMRFAEDAPDIQEGGAVTLRREQFQQKAPKA